MATTLEGDYSVSKSSYYEFLVIVSSLVYLIIYPVMLPLSDCSGGLPYVTDNITGSISINILVNHLELQS